MNAPQEQTRFAAAVEQPLASEADSDFERLLTQKQTSARDLLLNDSSFDKILKIAETMADGKHTVPKHLQGCLADCIAVTTQAFEWGMNPYTVAQKTHVVNGTLGYEAQLVMAVVERSGAIKGHFHFEWQKDNGGATLCRAGAVLRGDTEITWTEWHSSASVKVKNSPLWQTNVPQQMGYMQGRNWSRLYAPGAILGVYTTEELEQETPEAEPTAKRGPQRKSAAPAPTDEQNLAKATHRPGEAGRFPPADAAVDQGTGEIQQPAAEPAKTADAPAASTRAPNGGITGGQVAYLRNKLKSAGLAEQGICDRFQATSIELLTAEQFDTVKAELLAAT